MKGSYVLKRLFTGFLAGVLTTVILSTLVFPAIADSIDVKFNRVNIELNGEQVAKSDEYYTLDNGERVPYSISYGTGTTYLPLRKISELAGLEVNWDGVSRTVVLGSNGGVENKEIKNNENEINESEGNNRLGNITYEDFKSMWNVTLLSSYEEYNNYTGKYNGKMTEGELRKYLRSINRATLEVYLKDMAIETHQNQSEENFKDILNLSLTCRINNPPLDVVVTRIRIDSNFDTLDFSSP